MEGLRQGTLHFLVLPCCTTPSNCLIKPASAGAEADSSRRLCTVMQGEKWLSRANGMRLAVCVTCSPLWGQDLPAALDWERGSERPTSAYRCAAAFTYQVALVPLV